MSHVNVTVDGNLARVVLRNPPQNRLSPQLYDELREAMASIVGSGARAALLSAEGPDFSYGAILFPGHLEFAAAARRLRTTTGDAKSVERLPIPTVAAVQGLCFGGGFELAIRSDVIFAGANARFGHPEQSLGIVTMLGGIYRVAERAGKAFAMEWALTSEQVPARTMFERGVVNRLVADDALLTRLRSLRGGWPMGRPARIPLTSSAQDLERRGCGSGRQRVA